MKNKIYLIAVTIIAAMILLSCNKEGNLNTTGNLSNEKIEQDKRTENQIIKFKEKLDRLKTHPELKSGDETMSVDSAVWYMEATANYTYGDASYESSKFTIDSSVISIALTNNEILLADVQVAYEKTIDSIAAQYYNIDSDEKQLIVADISIKEVNDENVILYITSGIGSTQDCGLGLTNTYPWYWGWELGRCDGSGLGVGCDAADKIAQLANYEVAVPVGGTYYTDVDYRNATGCEYTNDNGDCLLFADFQEYTLVHQCLSTTEITFYKNGLKTVGNILKPSGKSVIRYSLIDLTAFALCGDPNYQQHDCWYMVHYATIKYGIWHTGGGGGSL